MTERWKGFLMAAIQTSKEVRQVHLWAVQPNMMPERQSLCGRLSWNRDVVDANVSTGWPDCNACVSEALRRRAYA